MQPRVKRILPAIDTLVRDLYADLAEGVGLAEAVVGIGRALDSHITALHREAPGRPGSVEVGGELAVAEILAINTEYVQRWQGENPWIARSVPGLEARGYQSTDEIISFAELQATEYYQQVLRPMDIAHAVGVSVSPVPGHAILAFNRSKRIGALNLAELAMVAALRPHLVSAHMLYNQLAQLGEQNATLRAAFDRSPVATLALDPHGWVLEHNRAADELLARRENGVYLSAGRALVFARAEVREAYLAALRRLALSGCNALPLPIAARVLGAPRNLFMHLCRAPAGRVIATLVDSDETSDAEYARQAVQGILGLTAQEANVCLTLRALGEPEAVALRLGLSLNTVRSHLKRAFGKTGVSKQSELVRMVDRIISTAPMA